jgi:hypothetical protein
MVMKHVENHYDIIYIKSYLQYSVLVLQLGTGGISVCVNQRIFSVASVIGAAVLVVAEYDTIDYYRRRRREKNRV